MKLATRNVNGIRAVAEKGFADWLLGSGIDILCIQEPKAFVDQIPASLAPLWDNYTHIWHNSTTPGYAGSAIIYRQSLDVSSGTAYFPHHTSLTDDGRTTEITLGTIKIINCYFPNGGTRADGREMLSYKLGFYESMADYIQSCQRQGYEIIVTGDFNICHREIDIARPKENEDSIGFLPIEREKIGRLMDVCHLSDMFRILHPDQRDAYTRRSYRAGARPRNVGRRLDYMMVSEGLRDQIISCEHLSDIMGSDHCPVLLER